VQYYRCTKCAFIFTKFLDDWTPDEVARFIYNADYVKVDPEYLGERARRTAADMARLLVGCERLRILDYGSGSGRFAKEMTERGFVSVEGYDPFSSPLRPPGPFDLVTCFEVIEHSPDPIATMRDMCEVLSVGGAIIIGQSLQPSNIDEIGGRWWYVAPRNGHVSMFAEESFVALASQVNLTYYRGVDVYPFARQNPTPVVLHAITQIGVPASVISLTAPQAPARSPGWHDVENGSDGMFRWTGDSAIRWPNAELGGGITVIKIPFISEIYDGFSQRCRIFVDTEEIPTRVQGYKLVAEVTRRDPLRADIWLQTPPPATPMELRGVPDHRSLGLAIRCARYFADNTGDY